MWCKLFLLWLLFVNTKYSVIQSAFTVETYITTPYANVLKLEYAKRAQVTYIPLLSILLLDVGFPSALFLYFPSILDVALPLLWLCKFIPKCFNTLCFTFNPWWLMSVMRVIQHDALNAK